ncbi:MAG TPA: HDIG domain-containing protein [Longimicrobiales bacterium]|nr:HDIG domain-containing protein [Longimicrobiales bacterium]
MSRPQGEGFSFLGALARPPRSAWPDGLVHHGARLLLLVVLAALLTVLFPPERQMEVGLGRYAEGMVADEDIMASVPFEVRKSPEDLEDERDEVRESQPPTFNYRPEASEDMEAGLQAFFARVDSATGGDDAALARVLEDQSISLTPQQRELLRDPETFRAIRDAAIQGARRILRQGVADAAQLDEYETPNITVRNPDGSETSRDRSTVMTAPDFYDRVVAQLPASYSPDTQQILRLVLIQFTEPSLELNVGATTTAQDRAARAVREITGQVLEGQIIVRAGDPITEADVQELAAYEERLQAQGLLEDGELELTPLFGSWLMNALILGVFGMLLFFFRREIYANPRWVALITLLAVAFFGGSALVASYGLRYELLPVAFVTLVVAVLWDGRMALVLGMVLAVAVGAQPPFAPEAVAVVVTTVLAGAAAALSVRVVRRRVQAWVFGALIAGAYALVILALTALGAKAGGEALPSLAYAGGNAFLSAILAMGFLPVFEWFAGITTDQTLLEWADPNRELLRRLSMEAPGTYAHTINVANLGESAAGAIGANGLLCRVGLYYHDVGKMLKPHYFVENQPEGRNPHDRLKPDTSAAIVKEHVTEGLRMAREAGVPEVVAAFIPEHHGNQRIGFFWEKAKEEYGEDALDPEDFRYPGPRPRSRETAIAMLADSVESATRALQDPTPERVRDLIHSIVDGKIADGQLDEAPLTLGEVGRIKDQFVKVLSGIYHHRIDYPQTKHLTDAPRGPAAEGAAPDRGEDGTGGGTGGTGQEGGAGVLAGAAAGATGGKDGAAGAREDASEETSEDRGPEPAEGSAGSADGGEPGPAPTPGRVS